MRDKKDNEVITRPQNQNAAYVNVAYGSSSGGNFAPAETPNVYESLRVSQPTKRGSKPPKETVQPQMSQINRRLLIALVIVGILCGALVAIVAWLLAANHEGTGQAQNLYNESLVPSRNGSSWVDHCLSSPCKNGALCVNLATAFRCSCTSGFQGETCEYDINECLNSPCALSATCQNSYGGFHCSCPRGFTGTYCQLGINECSSRPCQNGGTCFDMLNSYRCLCSAGYYGTNCQVRDHCRNQPCQNGAMCRSQTSTYSCHCHSGYTGRNCESAFVSRHPYRLVGTKLKYSGRVEVYHDGSWGTVCDDSWDNNDAKVFCKSLSLPYSNALGLQSAYFGQGNGTIWLDDVSCTGSESNITSCSHNAWGSHNCGHHEDASVICY